MRFHLLRKPVFAPSQFDRLSNIFDNAGQVALGAGVISPFFTGFDKSSIVSVVSGIALVSLCWSFSVWLAKRKEIVV